MKRDTIKSATRLFLALVSLLILQGCASMQGAAHYDSNSGGVVNIKGSILRW